MPENIKNLEEIKKELEVSDDYLYWQKIAEGLVFKIENLQAELTDLRLNELTRFSEIEKLQEENKIMREALTKLRDCDWIISLPDRMDAIRKIEGEALENTK